MKRIFQPAMMVCIAWMCICFANCSDDVIMETSQPNENGQPFRLTASQEAPSRLAINQNGLTVTWEPGDQLVLVRKDRTMVPIYMNTELTSPATSATFVSETSVPAGEYWVVYNYNDDLVYSYHGFSSIDAINNEDKLVLWGELTVVAGATSATISLQHLYAKVRVELENLPSGAGMADYQIGMYASKSGFPVYNQITQSGMLNVDHIYDYNSWRYVYKPTDRKYHNIRLGRYFIPGLYDEDTDEYNYDLTQKEEIEKNAALILPADVSDGTVYFYILSGNDCYEITKSNIKFDPGKSYKISLDMSTATKTTWTSTEVTLAGNSYSNTFYQLTSAEDFRHAAYYGNGENNYILMNDIDFQGDTFLPFAARRILGNGKSLKNIAVDWSSEDYVGLVRYEYNTNGEVGEVTYASLNPMSRNCTFTDLILENVQFKGNNYVGALGCTNVIADNCKLTGTSSVIGTGDYIGGLVGCNLIGEQIFISNSSIESCSIKGDNYVGGIVGKYMQDRDRVENFYSSLRLLKSCSSAATIEATGNYIGGLFGRIGEEYGTGVWFNSENYTLSLYECINTGDVTGKDYVGGIGGSFSVYSSNKAGQVVITKSANEGKNIKGENYVGGIVGENYATTDLCYTIGNISANGTNIGGIIGRKGDATVYVLNCYSMANLTIGQGGYSGGIVGYVPASAAPDLYVKNCYFAGTNSTGYGIVGYSDGNVDISSCLTTLASVIDSNGQTAVTNNVLTSVGSILQNINVINGDEAYSNVVWQGYQYDCVKFREGLSGSVVAPGFGIEIPY